MISTKQHFRKGKTIEAMVRSMATTDWDTGAKHMWCLG